ncbi:carbohydrate ABC transporter permease [Phytoactinopolyspora endophytica]|uniref:carbohydrate ABC transporter permease n=1 Tax=Phytoactinopolyspora endophytica TaxID=1642495 RepID=UPI00101D8068|nr:carbohydrate ABC transporter permease [Phytoactinopolyspora endophytica]
MTELATRPPAPTAGRRDGLRQPAKAITFQVGKWVLIAILIFIFVTPLWSIVAAALSGSAVPPGELVTVPEEITLSNITGTWGSGRIARYFFNSAVMAGIGVPLQVLVSALAAYALARKRFRGGAVVLLLILTTMMMPEEVIAIPLYLVLADVPPFGVSLLNSYPGLILPVVGWAFSIFVLVKFMREVPIEMEEAARIDGAGDFAIFWRIILPCVKPALGTVAVFGFLMIWDQYLLPLIVAEDTDMFTLQIALLNLRQDDMIPITIVMSAALLALLPSVVVYLALQRYFQSGLTAGSIKG